MRREKCATHGASVFWPLCIALLLCSLVFAKIGEFHGEQPSVQVSLSSGQKWSSGDTIRSFVLGHLQDSLKSQKPESFALSDNGIWGQRSWGCADPSTQGSLIAEKLLLFGSKADVASVRTGLHNTPVEEDGTVWAAESSPNHMDSGGSWEANAEYLISAALYATHTADNAAFIVNSERLVCYRPRGSNPTERGYGQVRIGERRGFVIAGGSGLDSAACEQSPRALSLLGAARVPGGEEIEALAPEWPNTAFTAARGLVSRGKVLGQVVELPEPFIELSVPLVRHTGGGFWPVVIEVFDEATGQRVAERSLDAAREIDWNKWAVIEMPSTQPAGTYSITLRLNPAHTDQPRTSAFWFSAGWVTRSGPLGPGATAFVQTQPPEGTAAALGPSGRLGTAVGEKCTRALALQLAMAQRNASHYGILVIQDARFRGTGEAGTVPSSSYWDLLNTGYKSAYINARFLQSLKAAQKLADAGLMKSPVPDLSGITRQVEQDFLTHFEARGGSLVSWIGCSRTAEGGGDAGSKAGCDPTRPNGPGQTAVRLGIVADSALAARVISRQTAPWLHRHNAALRAQARVALGLFRTNVIPVESVSVRLWAPARGWKLHNSSTGMADKVAEGQTGDWHLFSDGTGYGNFGNTEENGGVVVSNTAHIFRAGVYPEMFQDFSGLTDVIEILNHRLQDPDRAGGQLERSVPPAYLRERIEDPISKHLCKAARAKHMEVNQTDWFGGKWCDYYKSISWNLPEAGAFVSSFVYGILGLEIKPCQNLPLPSDKSIQMPFKHHSNNPLKWPCSETSVQIFGTSIPLVNGSCIDAKLPLEVAASWPQGVQDIRVSGIRFLGIGNIIIDCSFMDGNQDRSRQWQCAADGNNVSKQASNYTSEAGPAIRCQLLLSSIAGEISGNRKEGGSYAIF